MHPNTPPVGSFCRILNKKEAVGRKEVDPLKTNYSNSIFQILSYSTLRGPSARLRLLEVGSREPLKRLFYLDEIIPSIYSPDDYFIIQKVIKTKRDSRGKLISKVRWLDYNGKNAVAWVENKNMVQDYSAAKMQNR